MAPHESPLLGPRLLITALLGALPCLCANMAAWWPNVGVQVVMQDEESGKLHYSYCNTNYDVVFPVDEPLELPLEQQPRKGSPLAGVGWWDEVTTWACVWYFDDFDTLVYTRFRCDPDKGTFDRTNSEVISDELPKNVKLNPDSGVTAALLGATDGIRVYIHDDNDAIHSLMFSNDQTWKYEKLVNPDQERSGKAMGVIYRSGNANQITIIGPKDSENFEETRLDPDGIWYIDTFPIPLSGFNITNLSPEDDYSTSSFESSSSTKLEAWTGDPGNIGVAFGDRYRSLFYIGSDKAVHQLNSYPNADKSGSNSDSEAIDGGTWQNVDAQDESKWPLADDENAKFGIASWLDDGGHVRLFYMAGGALTAAVFENNTWYDAEKVATELPPSEPTESEPAKKSGLSNGAKAGIGVGSFLGAFALAAVIGSCIFVRRRRRQQQEERIASAAAAAAAFQSPSPHPGEEQYQTYSTYSQPYQGHMSQMSGQSYGYIPAVSPEPVEPKTESVVINELPPNELPEHGMHSYESHEMLGEGHFREMPSNGQTGEIQIRREG